VVTAAQEQATMRALGALASVVLPHATAHPDDPDVPEALHRLVRVTRYAREGNPTVSKAAFTLPPALPIPADGSVIACYERREGGVLEMTAHPRPR
jgi:hypothetical protein